MSKSQGLLLFSFPTKIALQAKRWFAMELEGTQHMPKNTGAFYLAFILWSDWLWNLKYNHAPYVAERELKQAAWPTSYVGSHKERDHALGKNEPTPNQIAIPRLKAKAHKGKGSATGISSRK